MTTSRETDIMRVEAKVKTLDMYRKWLQDKLGNRAQDTGPSTELMRMQGASDEFQESYGEE